MQTFSKTQTTKEIMKLSAFIPMLASGIAITTGTVAAGVSGKGEVRLEDAPQAVRAAITEHSHSLHFDELETARIEGRLFYIAEFDLPDDHDLELYFSEDGMLWRSVQEINLADAPPAVRKTVESIVAEAGTLDDIEEVVSGGTLRYHVEIDRPGPDLYLVISELGGIIEQMEKVKK